GELRTDAARMGNRRFACGKIGIAAELGGFGAHGTCANRDSLCARYPPSSGAPTPARGQGATCPHLVAPTLPRVNKRTPLPSCGLTHIEERQVGLISANH